MGRGLLFSGLEATATAAAAEATTTQVLRRGGKGRYEEEPPSHPSIAVATDRIERRGGGLELR